MAGRVEALSLLGTPQRAVGRGSNLLQSQVAAGAKNGEILSRERSYGFSPEKR